MMKTRILALLGLCVLGVVAITNVNAQEEDELVKLLDEMAAGEDVANDTAPEDDAEEHEAANDILDGIEDDAWAWAGPENITISDVGADSATIQTTQITFNGTPVDQYKVYFSDRTLATFQDYDKIQDVIVSPKRTVGTTVSLELTGLSAETKYYVVVAPVHPTDPSTDPLTMISEEQSFVTAKAPVDTTNAKVFNDVSYTYKDGTVTLTWDSSTAAEKAEIHLRHQSEATYTKIGTPAFADGEFTFSVDNAGNYFLKMIALDASGNATGKEHIQTVKIDKVVPTEDKPIEKAPQVGPATDMIIALFVFAMIIYFVYRFRRIEK